MIADISAGSLDTLIMRHMTDVKQVRGLRSPRYWQRS